MADLGYFSLALALVVALFTLLAALLGARGRPELVAAARNGTFALLGLTSLASAVLAYAFISHDFSLEYVAAYSARGMSTFYTLAGLWAGNEGSLLLWSWVLALMAAVVLWQKPRRDFLPYILAVVAANQAFFLLLMLSVANPFERLPFALADGRGLNPLLENPGMLFHPTTLLAGYSAFTIPFAFAVAALATGQLGEEWLRPARRYALVAWLFLGVGNILGAWWAYVELGWGGYWAWDAVENAGLMPWLTGTAFLHSAIIQRRRGMLKVWNMVLIIVTFNLCLFGTFLTRSGVVSSIHTFGISSLGPLFLGFIFLSLLVPVILLYWRLPSLRSEDRLDSLVSRESSFLLNNLLLVAIAFATFLGTMYPAISEAVGGVRVTVGPSFFNQVNGSLFLVFILLMGICPLVGWRRATPRNLLRRLLIPATAAALVVVLLIIWTRTWYALVGFGACAFVLATILLEWFRGVRARHRKGENYFTAFFRLLWGNRPRYGGYIVHAGIILIALAVIGSSFYKVEAEDSLNVGESFQIGKYTLQYEGMSTSPTAKKEVVSATLQVLNNGKPAGIMAPAKTFHVNYDSPVSEVAIRTGPLEDLYVIFLGSDQIGGLAAFKAYINPLMVWMWIGGFLFLLGSVIAIWPERRRAPVPA
ncbi:MAG: heme lyase CcmF/NrfE family subunit [Chloroflexi bacterium]|nr:heme lyase CcmF/NrfE family subunit [Chloroflexota bacterium]